MVAAAVPSRCRHRTRWHVLGYVLLNTESSFMDPTVTQYRVSVQRKVGDRDFVCFGTSKYGADDAACMIAACLSVRAK